jgi:hypothetical protein
MNEVKNPEARPHAVIKLDSPLTLRMTAGRGSRLIAAFGRVGK